MTAAVIDAPPATDAPAPDAGPLFVQPTAADREPRRAEPPRDMPHDPEAPYGWMRDPKTGETRPKKTAGRQKVETGKRKAAPAPPKRRASNVARVARPPAEMTPVGAAPVAAADHAEMVGGLVDMAWMIAAALPVPKPSTTPKRFDMSGLSIRLRATAYILSEHKPALAQQGGTIADHVDSIGRGVEALSAKDGKAWVFPVALGLLPFAAAMGAIWRAPLAEIAPLAEATTQQFRALAESELARVQAAQQQAAAEQANGRALIPGEQPLPGMAA